MRSSNGSNVAMKAVGQQRQRDERGGNIGQLEAMSQLSKPVASTVAIQVSEQPMTNEER